MPKFIPSPLPPEEQRHWSEDRDNSFKEYVSRKWAGSVTAKTPGQQAYLDAIDAHVVTLCSGPAGSGKTFLAIGTAVRHLKQGKVDRIVLTRPLQECDEKVGTLPGDMREKIDDMLRPMLDALCAFLPAADVEELIRDKTIQLIPLAKMRGLSIKRAFIVLDEGQNCTRRQLRMFLTRFEGEGVKVVAVGDETQSDLPYAGGNSLSDAFARFSPDCHKDVGLVRLGREDIVRHPLIQWIDERLLDGPPVPKAEPEPPPESPFSRFKACPFVPTDDPPTYLPTHATVPCPECDKDLWFTPAMRELVVECPHCGAAVELEDENGKLNPIAVDDPPDCKALTS